MLDLTLETVYQLHFSIPCTVFCIFYVSYYLLVVGRRPKLICGNEDLKRSLEKNLDVVKSVYWPTFWCFSAHPMTVFSALLLRKSNVPYQRENLATPDGGILALDWVKNDENNELYPNPESRPTIVIVPGMTGCSDESYCRQIVLAAMQKGLRALVMTNRGSGKNWELKTPRMFSGNNTDDIKFVMKHLESMYPNSPIIGVGISFGGCIMTHFVSELGEDCRQMVGAFLVSVQWNCYKSLDSLDRPLNWLLYNRYLLKHLKAIIQRNLHIYEQHINNLPCQLDDVFKSKTLREFDDHFTSKMFGYDNNKEYYDDASLDSERTLKRIRIPTVYLSSEDDPFAPGWTIPKELIKQTSHVAVISTEYGGHIGFMESIHMRSGSLVEKSLKQFLNFVLS